MKKIKEIFPSESLVFMNKVLNEVFANCYTIVKKVISSNR